MARGNRSLEGKAVRPLKNSPIDWNDSGRVRAVGKVPGGSVDPGKKISGLARAAATAGAQIAERAEVSEIEFANPVRLQVRRRLNGRLEEKVVTADKVLLATNAGSLELAGKIHAGREPAEPKLTFAIATAPLTRKQIAAIGLSSGRPFYSVDLPYLWGRLLKNGGLIFGSGLVPAFGESLRDRAQLSKSTDLSVNNIWSGLEDFNIGRGEPAARIRSLEERLRRIHPAMKNVKVTHRWGGSILITKKFVPVFRRHPKSTNVLVLGGYSGHGVALSVYWASVLRKCCLTKDIRQIGSDYSLLCSSLSGLYSGASQSLWLLRGRMSLWSRRRFFLTSLAGTAAGTATFSERTLQGRLGQSRWARVCKQAR